MAVFAMPRTRALDSNVAAMSGAKLYFYQPETTTEKPVYSDSDLTTPIAQPVTADAAGEFATIYTSGEYKVVLKTSAGVTVWTQDHVEWGATERTLSPSDYGAVGDGATDDTTALQDTINAAGALASISANYVTINLAGKSYAVSAPLEFDGFSNIIVKNGGLSAIGTWAADDPILNIEHTGTYRSGAQGISISELFIQGNQLANGIYVSNMFRTSIQDCYIVGYPDFGIRTVDKESVSNIKNGDMYLRRVRCEQYQSDVATAGTYTGIGFHIRAGDSSMVNCKASRNKINALFDGPGAFQVLGCHFFNAQNSTVAVSNCADNGSGKVRVTTASAHGFATDDWIRLDDIGGTVEAVPLTGDVGKWIITVIDSTTFDLNDCTFVNAYTSGGTARYPRPNVVIKSTPCRMWFCNNYLDTTDVIIFTAGTTSTMLMGNQWILNDPDLVFVSTVASEKARDYIVVGNQFTTNPFFRTSGSGTWGPLNMAAIGNSKLGGGQASGIGRVSVAVGSAGAPSIVFGLETLSGNDWDTGIYSPDTDEVAISTQGNKRFHVDADGNIILGAAQLADAATDGFLYLPGTTSGTPSGTPTSYSGRHPMVYDDTNKRLWVHDGAKWQDASRTYQHAANLGGDGQTVTITNDTRVFLTTDTSTRATATINFPTTPRQGQMLTIYFRGAITSLTVSGNGATLVGTAPTSAAAGDSTTWFYSNDGGLNHWFQIAAYP